MAGDIESDEAALRRAIEAAPDDDAPWLVYADWLQEHGRDAEAAAVSRSLPALQLAVRAGRPVSAAMEVLLRYGSAAVRYGIPTPPPAPPRPLPPAPRPDPPAWTGLDGPEGPVVRPIMLVVLLLSCFAGVIQFGLQGGRPRSPSDRPGEGPVTKEMLAEAQRISQAKEDPPAAPRVRPASEEPPPRRATGPGPWEPAELVGYTLRLDDPWSVLAFTFNANGTAEVRQGLKGGFQIRADGHWWIEPLGALNVTSSDGRWLYLLSKRKTDGDRYEVTRRGQSEVYVREPAGP